MHEKTPRLPLAIDGGESPAAIADAAVENSFAAEVQEDVEIANEVARGGYDIFKGVWRLIRTLPRILLSLGRKLLHVLDLIAKSIKWFFVHPLRFLLNQVHRVLSRLPTQLVKAWIGIVKILVLVLTFGTHVVVPRTVSRGIKQGR